eukprot:18260-Eustigmatos_ZCMA.PRE.1
MVSPAYLCEVVLRFKELPVWPAFLDATCLRRGALAMIAEQAALAQSRWTGAGGHRLRRMKMSYMAP